MTPNDLNAFMQTAAEIQARQAKFQSQVTSISCLLVGTFGIIALALLVIAFGVLF